MSMSMLLNAAMTVDGGSAPSPSQLQVQSRRIPIEFLLASDTSPSASKPNIQLPPNCQTDVQWAQAASNVPVTLPAHSTQVRQHMDSYAAPPQLFPSHKRMAQAKFALSSEFYNNQLCEGTTAYPDSAPLRAGGMREERTPSPRVQNGSSFGQRPCHGAKIRDGQAVCRHASSRTGHGSKCCSLSESTGRSERHSPLGASMFAPSEPDLYSDMLSITPHAELQLSMDSLPVERREWIISKHDSRGSSSREGGNNSPALHGLNVSPVSARWLPDPTKVYRQTNEMEREIYEKVNARQRDEVMRERSEDLEIAGLPSTAPLHTPRSGDDEEGNCSTDSDQKGLDRAPRRRWKDWEDSLLIQVVERDGPSQWNEIAKNFPGRNGRQVRLRWMNHLQPSLDRAPWRAEEDATLLDVQGKLGNKWALIAAQLGGRTDNSVKNRFKSLQRRRNREARAAHRHDRFSQG